MDLIARDVRSLESASLYLERASEEDETCVGAMLRSSRSLTPLGNASSLCSAADRCADSDSTRARSGSRSCAHESLVETVSSATPCSASDDAGNTTTPSESG